MNIQSKGRLKRGSAVKKEEEEKEKVPFISSSVDWTDFFAQKVRSHARGYGYAVIILTNDLISFSHDERCFGSGNSALPEIKTIFPFPLKETKHGS